MSLNLGRIWSRIVRVKDGCWIWPGNKNPRGYGIVGIEKKQYLAHRVAWQNFHDRDPGEQIVMHDCDNPSCVNPEHLTLGDRIKNNADMRARGRGCNPPRHVGEKHPQAKLTKEQAREVFQRRDNGEPLKVLAEEFGISEAAVSYIYHGKNWASVTKDLTRNRL